MKPRDVRIVGVLAAAGLLAGGCGGSSPAKAHSTAPTAPPNPTRAFIVRADAVCQGLRTALGQFRTETRSLASLGDSPRGFALAAPLIRRVQGLEQDELSRLRALPAPPNSAPVAAYLRVGAQSVALVGRLATAFAHRDRRAITADERQGNRMAATAKGIAQGYGFRVCGNGGAGNGL